MGFPDEDQVTAYFSHNMKKADLALIKKFMDSRQLSLLNTRAFKVQEANPKKNLKTHYIISIGSIDTEKTQR